MTILLSQLIHLAGIANAYARKLTVPLININCLMVFEKET